MTDNRERIEALKAQVEPFRFDPRQKRDGDGQWTRSGLPPAVGGERIKLLKDRVAGTREESGLLNPSPTDLKTDLGKRILKVEDTQRRSLIRKASDDELANTLRELNALPKSERYTIPGAPARMAKMDIEREQKRRRDGGDDTSAGGPGRPYQYPASDAGYRKYPTRADGSA